MRTCLFGLAAILALSARPPAARADGRDGVPELDHVFVIVLENHNSFTSFGSLGILDNPMAPKITQLAKTYNVAANYHGVWHLPNYLAMITGDWTGTDVLGTGHLYPAGSTVGVSDDDSHFPISAPATNPCTGETLQGSGFEHVKMYESFAPNYHVSMEANVESFQATTITGVRYVVPEQLSSHTIADTDAVPVNATYEATAQLIRQAEDGSLVMGDDFYVRISAHYTYNGNGDLTASFSDMTMECR